MLMERSCWLTEGCLSIFSRGFGSSFKIFHQKSELDDYRCVISQGRRCIASIC